MSALPIPFQSDYTWKDALILMNEEQQATESNTGDIWDFLFHELHQGVMGHILSFSTLSDIPNYATVCSSWNQIILESNSIWVGLCVSIEQCLTRHVRPEHRQLLNNPEWHRTLISIIEEEEEYKMKLNMDKEQRFKEEGQSMSPVIECSARKALRIATVPNPKVDANQRMIFLEEIGSLSVHDIASHFEQFGIVEEITFVPFADSAAMDPFYHYAIVVFLNIEDMMMATNDLYPVIRGQQCICNAAPTSCGHEARDTAALSPDLVGNPQFADIDEFDSSAMSTIFGDIQQH